MPGLPVGYVWANSWLSLIHSPWINELLYSAIVVFRIVPVGAIALWLVVERLVQAFIYMSRALGSLGT